MSHLHYLPDARAVAGALAMLAVAALLLAWQQRGDPARLRAWLGYGALFLELLAAGLAIAWAVDQGGGLLVLLFAAGFVGMALSKATTVSAVVNGWRGGNHGAAVVGGLTLAGLYAVVYLAGVFGGAQGTAQKTATAAAQSAPVAALDAQLDAAREKLASLAPYADPVKADVESQAQAQADQAQAARVAALQEKVGAARAAAAPYANPDCTPKKDSRGEPYTTRAAAACAAIEQAQAALLRAERGGSGSAGGYAQRHAEYNGVRAHVADLETRRADLLSQGGAAQAQAAGADDRLVAWLLGVTTEQAAGLKWLFFVLAFDVLSLGMRLTSEMQGGDNTTQARRRFNALLSGGLSPAEAAAAMGSPAHPSRLPPAGVVRPNEMDGAVVPPAHVPALDTGAFITADGYAYLHAGERVLNPAETAEYQRWKTQHAPLSQQGHAGHAGHVPVSQQGHAGQAGHGGHVPAGTRSKSAPDIAGQADMSQQGHAGHAKRRAVSQQGQGGQPPVRVASDVGAKCKYDKIVDALIAARDSDAYADQFAKISAMNMVGKRAAMRGLIKDLLGAGEGCETGMLDKIIREVM